MKFYNPVRPMDRFENVSVSFTMKESDVRRALSDLSLEIQEGEFVVFVGKSGCGKTTALNMLGALVTPTGGRIEVGVLL